jgi:hypothetical protein
MTTTFYNHLLKYIFKYKEIHWCRFTEHSKYTNNIGLMYGGFVYAFVWNNVKPSSNQTIFNFPGNCVYIGQTTAEEYCDKKSHRLTKLYSSSAKRMQEHFTALVGGKSKEEKYELFYEKYGYGKNVLDGENTLWLMMIPVMSEKSYFVDLNKRSWALALEAMMIFFYGLFNGSTPFMNRQVIVKDKKTDTFSFELSETKNSILEFMQ